MENSEKETCHISLKLYQKSLCANNLQEKVVEIDMLRKDLTTSNEKYKLTYYTKAKKKHPQETQGGRKLTIILQSKPGKISQPRKLSCIIKL